MNIFWEVKTHKILKSSFLTRFCPQGTCGVEKLPWESFLCTIIVLTLAPILTLTSSLGYFFDSGPLGVPKDTLVCWAAFLWIFVERPKIEYFSTGGIGAVWPKMTKFWSRHFSLVFVPKELAVSETFPDTLIRLPACLWIFCWEAKNRVFSDRGYWRSGQKWQNFEDVIFHSFLFTGNSPCRKTPYFCVGGTKIEYFPMGEWEG